MSKIRIHELAKELGVDNKVIIAKSTELGFKGKSSHSNSLESDEADQIRRAIIRQAIGSSPESQRVTTKVDTVTGSTKTIVESRKGDVIRRRRQVNDSSSEGQEISVAQHEEPSYGSSALSESESIRDTLPIPSAVFSESEAEIPETPKVKEGGLTNGSGTAASVKLKEPTHDLESKPPEKLDEEIAPEIEEEIARSPVEEEEKKTPGPRVLGRIDLPVKKVIKPEAKKPLAGAVEVGEAPRLDVEEEDEWGRKSKEGKRKTRKREINRVDLIDYEGRPQRRVGRGTTKSPTKDMEAQADPGEAARPKVSKRVLKLGEAVSVGELARQMSLKVGEIIAKLMELGVLATINQIIDYDTASLIAEAMGYEIESTDFNEAGILEEEVKSDPANLSPRPPVVTVMGHVDHGKTSLLDAIRKASVAEKEHGGITQHIGAYTTVLEDGRKVTFIDTPGHAAFTALRARGASVTDIVVLVVAADDGVMPQTIEAINHAKAAEVSIIVAINKIDRPGINLDRLKKQLVEQGLQPEEWGGDTMYYLVSALKGQGIKELLEGILLLAEVKELKADANRRAKGTIIEARQDRGRGTVATVLVQEGTLKVGDIFVAGAVSGRVRSMLDHLGTPMTEALPSTPVEITGWMDVPVGGDDFVVVESEADAREVAGHRAEKRFEKERLAAGVGVLSLEEFSKRANQIAQRELNVIVKADVHGSVEALRDSLHKLSRPDVRVRVVHAGVGGINESDVQLAIASGAVIIGFGVRAEPRALADAETNGIEIRFYRIIYELIDDIKKAMAGLLEPIRKEVTLGRAEVRETFIVPKIGTIAGCFVNDGLVKRGSKVRLVRDSRVIHEGKMGSLRRFKDDVREVQSGYECGIGIEGFNDVKQGDVMEIFEIQETPVTID